MRAILVCVDYSDLLSITLPYNRHHFSEVCVVTSKSDNKTFRVAEDNKADVYRTDSFYDNGAIMNKWKALEEALDIFGRKGWLCIMDADVLWPKSLIVNENPEGTEQLWFETQGPKGWPECGQQLHRGNLYSPLRRMWDNWPIFPEAFDGSRDANGNWLVDESCWSKFPVHRNVAEFAGYSQIFHASDPVLGPAPWHQVDWKHAGGADSGFQNKWPASKKVRPPFECLHLGQAGQNWYGRATPYADGTVPQDVDKKRSLISQIWSGRAQRRQRGLEPFGPERIS